MVLRDLLESARRDIYNQLDNTVIYIDPESGSEILLRLAAHLNDERNNGEARGDHAPIAEIRSAARVGLKKLIAKHGMEALISKDKNQNHTIGIMFKLKKQRTIINYDKGKVKLNLYVTLAASLFKTSTGETVFRIFTIYPPTTRKEFEAKVKFKLELYN